MVVQGGDVLSPPRVCQANISHVTWDLTSKGAIFSERDGKTKRIQLLVDLLKDLAVLDIIALKHTLKPP